MAGKRRTRSQAGTADQPIRYGVQVNFEDVEEGVQPPDVLVHVFDVNGQHVASAAWATRGSTPIRCVRASRSRT
jgi:hypothetical protein